MKKDYLNCSSAGTVLCPNKNNKLMLELISSSQKPTKQIDIDLIDKIDSICSSCEDFASKSQ